MGITREKATQPTKKHARRKEHAEKVIFLHIVPKSRIRWSHTVLSGSRTPHHAAARVRYEWRVAIHHMSSSAARFSFGFYSTVAKRLPSMATASDFGRPCAPGFTRDSHQWSHEKTDSIPVGATNPEPVSRTGISYDIGSRAPYPTASEVQNAHLTNGTLTEQYGPGQLETNPRRSSTEVDGATRERRLRRDLHFPAKLPSLSP